MVANKELDISHIDFAIPLDYNEKLKVYAQFISWECYIWGIPLIVSHLEDWHAAL
jgi:hypothetical protein